LERINLRGQPIDLDITLNCGQAFRWRKREDGVWCGVVRDRLIELTTADGGLLWRTYPAGGLDLVTDYFRLNENVNAIYAYLADRDRRLAELTHRFHGLRLLRQDPTETLLSFICSAATSIPRIMAAIEGLAETYGDLVCEKESLCYYAFPKVERLAGLDSLTSELRQALGFRRDNLRIAARQIADRGEGWLISLRKAGYPEAKAALLGIRGVGRKIADCTCLFSLDKDDAVPVDTHVRQVAHRYFLPDLNSGSVTDAVYNKVAQAFVERFGQYAGWAQEFLFYEDLLRTRALGRGAAYTTNSGRPTWPRRSPI